MAHRDERGIGLATKPGEHDHDKRERRHRKREEKRRRDAVRPPESFERWCPRVASWSRSRITKPATR